MSDGRNRRGAVRATDRVLLAYKKVSAEKFEDIAEDYRQGISIYTQEGLSDIQMYVGAHAALDRLRAKDPDMADFLRHLDNKINLLLKRVKGERSVFDALKMQKVNLSGKGLSFYSFEAFQPGDLIEVHLALLPAYTFLYFFVRVVKCESEGEHQGKTIYRVGSEFALLMEEDRDKLVQHSFRQQSMALRSRRSENDQ
ncbi:PilZ domain-containing protein [Desulfurivibrio alkaliphilus]|uniref:Type IV pilus assembly PilZ n=1 Tax=Desulfurivibrio alkaliphilus (strain DSM 19089 / UNIQEM U267 / AHT2) TaxID=589865 RepID=D6Z2X4_DESAT|nr:PilZ domain-containing protein [Desulfurivibrio alkaliphilus]ADH85899.1 type IV pilus assembly PilZ [Desulfurivibrio alkaliphilus AHT 2]